MSKRTIAIIGATEELGSAFSIGLAKRNYRLLLFDPDIRKLALLGHEIRSLAPSADVEFMNCVMNASWEADIIILTARGNEKKELARKIEQVTNRKIVLNLLSDDDKDDLRKFLPGATIVNIVTRVNHVIDIHSSNADANETAKEIIRAAGFRPATSNNKNNLNQSKINTMETTKWTLDPTHSEIHFKVRHLMVSWVTGSFKQFDASVETDGEDITTAKVKFTAQVNSISTNNEQRDAHLRASDFFDAANHPQLSFESEKLEKIDDENYKLYGTLTIRGNSKKIALNVEYGGVAKDPWGNTRTGFSVSGKINRKDFGVSFSMVSETGGILLGEDVSINANVEFVQQVAAQVKAA